MVKGQIQYNKDNLDLVALTYHCGPMIVTLELLKFDTSHNWSVGKSFEIHTQLQSRICCFHGNTIHCLEAKQTIAGRIDMFSTKPNLAHVILHTTIAPNVSISDLNAFSIIHFSLNLISSWICLQRSLACGSIRPLAIRIFS